MRLITRMQFIPDAKNKVKNWKRKGILLIFTRMIYDYMVPTQHNITGTIFHQ